MDECRTIVPSGYLEKTVDATKLVEVDENKAFTWGNNQMKQSVTFTEFDIWKPFDETIDIYKMNDWTMYYVEAFEANIFFNKRFNIPYGYFLKKLISNGVKVKIHYYKEPSTITDVNHSELIDELWATKISDDVDEDKQIKKKIANIVFGMLEKSTNTAQKSHIFNSLREACYYQRENGGRIYAIQEETEDEEKKTMGDTCYILNTTDRKKLVNGFRPMKEMLLQFHNFKMYETYKKLVENGIKVYSVKSDAFCIHEDDLTQVMGKPNHFIKSYREGLLKFGDGIGEWKVSKKSIHLPPDKYKFKYNKLIKIPIYTNEEIIPKDEWNTPEICNEVKEKNPCMIKADLPGSGKSFIGKHFEKMGYNVLFVCPTNHLNQNCECEGVTTNKFFSVGVDENNDKLPVYDHSKFNVICFDEVYCNDGYMYSRIKRFVEQHKQNKILLAMGDVNQLPTITPLSNTKPFQQYADECISQIFKYEINLKECKRLTKEEDRTKLKNIKQDIFINNLPFKQIVEKYFEYVDDIEICYNNIAYTNEACKKVSNQIRQLLNKQHEYEIGNTMICKKYMKFKSHTYNVNFRYKIISLNSTMGILQNVKTKEEHPIHIDTLRANFIYSYCYTAHSTQGCSIDGDVVIYEWTHPRVTKEWLFVSLTRAKDLNKVRFFRK